MSLQKRFESRIQPEPNSGCWLWDAGYSSTGYGAIRVKGKQVGAHRVAHELYIGPIPDGMHVCHTCDNPACVNPDHLTLGTPKSRTGRIMKKHGRNFMKPKNPYMTCEHCNGIAHIVWFSRKHGDCYPGMNAKYTNFSCNKV